MNFMGISQKMKCQSLHYFLSEKSNKLPFYKFESFEFSPKGIDCIAKYKITQDDVIRTLPVNLNINIRILFYMVIQLIIVKL